MELLQLQVKSGTWEMSSLRFAEDEWKFKSEMLLGV